jgi:hypothetical protein
VGTRTPLLHDGRAATLVDVLIRLHHPRDASFTPRQLDDLLAFLRGL